ncbi:MAG TPA: hypothetical protein VF843_17690 [Streptosporangiaceae bacterium]
MRRHLSAEVLARYQEGDLGPRRTASVAAHLSACERCARTGSDLTAVSGLLAGLGSATAPMPEALADRLQLAIARESEVRAASYAPADQRDHIPGRPDLPERTARTPRSWLRLRWPGWSSPLLLRGTAAVAAILVLAGAGFWLANGTSPSTENGAGSAGSSGSVRVPATSGAGRHHGAENVPAAVTGSARLHYRLRGKIVATTALASHLDFTKANLARQVREQVASHPAFGNMNTSPTSTPGPSGGKRAPVLGGIRTSTLNGCLSLVSAGRRVVLTEIARYLGKPATIIVLRSSTANILDVAVVGVACSASAADYIVRTTIPAG